MAFSPCGVSVTAGTVYAAAGETVRQVSPQGVLTTPAATGSFGPLGDGGPAARANLASACGTAVDSSGNLIIADDGDFRVRAVAATTGTFYGQAMHAGDIYTIAGGGTSLGDHIPATSAGISPAGVALDAAGNLLIADSDRIRVVAASTGTFYGQPMTAGDIYTVAGGGPTAWVTVARPPSPRDSRTGWRWTHAGNLVIADTGNDRIRVVAASTGTFYGQAMTAGDIYTVAGDGSGGSPVTAARPPRPSSVSRGGGGGRLGQRGDRRHRQPPDPGGGGRPPARSTGRR